MIILADHILKIIVLFYGLIKLEIFIGEVKNILLMKKILQPK